jgi:hypothetical protein
LITSASFSREPPASAPALAGGSRLKFGEPGGWTAVVPLRKPRGLLGHISTGIEQACIVALSLFHISFENRRGKSDSRWNQE